MCNEAAVFLAEEDDIVPAESEPDLLSEVIHDAAEDNAGQQEVAHLYLNGRFHTGRHSGVDFTFDRTVIAKVKEFGTDADDKIIFGGFDLIAEVLGFVDKRNMMTEEGVLVALFDIALLFGLSASASLWAASALACS